VSSFTEHPLVVLSSVLGGIILSGVLGAIPALEPIRPFLLTDGWAAGVDVLRDPLPTAGLVSSTGLAAGWFAAAAVVLVSRRRRRDA
jgi:ABC-2 type transport system permease protein